MRMDHVVKVDQMKREREKDSRFKRKTTVGLRKTEKEII